MRQIFSTPRPLRILLAVFLSTTVGVSSAGESSPEILDVPREGDLTAVKDQAERIRERLHAMHGDGTLSHHSTPGSQKEMIAYLFAEDPDVNARDSFDRTPLHEAASKGEVVAIIRLLARGAKVDARDRFGYTPLHRAFDTHRSGTEPMPPAEKRQRLAAVKLLVGAGANVNARSNRERTPLHFAAKSNLPKVIEFLVDQGAEVDVKDSDGWTPLHVAAGATRSVETLKTLVEQGADPTARMEGPSRDLGIDMTYNVLSWAALWGNQEMVKFLLEIDVPTRYGSGESEHSALYDALIGASAARREGADKKQITEHFAVIDLLAEEMGGINAGVKHGSFDGTALEAATAPYVARHLLTEHSDEFTAEDIETAIEATEKKINSRSRRIRDEPEETLEALREFLLIYSVFEAKQREQSGSQQE